MIQKHGDVTIVTGLWDLGREKLSGWAQRDFKRYKENFFKLLKADVPMCIWIPRDLEEEVWNIRKKENTRIFYKEIEDFKTWFPFFEEHDKIRKDPDWYNGASWLSNSPQAALELYNPMMMTKMFMVNDSTIHNPFNTNYFYWIDGGLTSTVSEGYFIDGTIFKNITQAYEDTVVHITYPYTPSNEIHGFKKSEMYKACNLSDNEEVIQISRGGFWGGPKRLINEYNRLYYNVLSSTIASGNIGADECLFTILAHRHPDLITTFTVEGNGLVWPFFEAMQNIEQFLNSVEKKSITYTTAKCNLYVLGFNSPKQFEELCKSLEENSKDFLNKSKKFLINNSIDKTLFAEYDRLCEMYDFEEIHLDNVGICGGRQYVAEHFDKTDAHFYMIFEDDMCINDISTLGQFCRNGFRKYVPNVYETVIKIMLKENFDFLKFSFSEFYGDNSVQWAWYNVPQQVRTHFWSTYDKLPQQGLDANAPKTEFKTIEYMNEIPYIRGDIYYSNWPQIVSREGNKKMFLDTIWKNPFEQTWMSHIFQLTKENKISAGILLASPVTHDRFEHYPGNLRKES
jgi:hypothetical protein